jgi:hypothetical protein
MREPYRQRFVFTAVAADKLAGGKRNRKTLGLERRDPCVG